jgi:hypothetical protein
MDLQFISKRESLYIYILPFSMNIMQHTQSQVIKEYTVYLLKYLRGKQQLNRIYAIQGKTENCLSDQIQDFVNTVEYGILENVAIAVEKEFLSKLDFIILKGIKKNIFSYKDKIRNIYKIRVREPQN